MLRISVIIEYLAAGLEFIRTEALNIISPGPVKKADVETAVNNLVEAIQQQRPGSPKASEVYGLDYTFYVESIFRD